jgi:hypothetical protein
MERFFVSCPITYHLQYFYIAIAVFPCLLILACLICFFASPSTIATLPKGAHVPAFSELVVDSPQDRIWGVGMTLQSIFLLLFGLLRDHIVQLYVERTDLSRRRVCTVLLAVSRVLIILTSFALVFLACVPVKSGSPIHSPAGAVFFSGLSLYFFVGDFLTWRKGRTIKVVSVGLTLASVVLMIVAVVVKYTNNSPVAYDASSVLGYLAVIGAFAKLIILKMDMPAHGLRLSRKAGYEDGSQRAGE